MRNKGERWASTAIPLLLATVISWKAFANNELILHLSGQPWHIQPTLAAVLGGGVLENFPPSAMVN